MAHEAHRTSEGPPLPGRLGPTPDGVTELATRVPKFTPEEVADRQRARLEAAPRNDGGFETPTHDVLRAVEDGLRRWLGQ
ncbi:hypothetical protein [Streptomyces halstedii]|uniref:Uncharacterized protein n=1 Tax=Streptomyces halstedii TaxID=1944 RepID=A0A6N9TYS5_STRHA|nr:hypothetical protein [Streptomyces halstedii]NEA16680.1 hypothetical protein [Streptomyces halstedii]